MNSLHKIFLTVMTAASGTAMFAQNPFVVGQFTADPTARVFGNRIYVYPSHDILPPAGQRQDWFCMADYHVFSSSDLVEWTDHGMILDQKQVPWGAPEGYSMWAPDCIQGKDGRYYFYFPDAPKGGRGFGVGVAISDTPTGPFVPQAENIKGVSGIDPCVLQASDGNNYIFWGGGGLRVAKLKDNLLELSEDNPVDTVKFGDRQMVTVGVACDKTLPEGFKEGPFAFERNGKYYLTYPWVRYKKGDKNEKGETLDNPTETLAYAMSDNPMGPYEYKGLIMKESPVGCWTNHHSIVNYKGQWYLFYHHNDYSPNDDKRRSVRIDSLHFNADGTIQEVIPTLRGAGITDGSKPIQLDRYSAISPEGASIAFLDTTDRFKGWKICLEPGAWVRYNTVSLPTDRSTISAIDPQGQKKRFEDLGLTFCTIAKEVNGQTLHDVIVTNKGSQRQEIDYIEVGPLETHYFNPITTDAVTPGEEGWISRWMLLEPIDKPNRSNTVFTDSYLREHFNKEYFKDQMTMLPKDKQKVTATTIDKDGKPEKQKLTWHALESARYNVKLFRFATGLQKQYYGVLFWAVTIIDCPEEIKDVRLAVGSNSASMWWLNGEETLLLSGDRRMVKDDCMSQRITLKKGRNVLRGAIINGPGMSDFCVRFIDEQGKPVRAFSVTLKNK